MTTAYKYSGDASDEPSLLESAWGLTSGTVVAGVKDIVDSVGTAAFAVGEGLGISDSAYERSDTRAVIEEYAGESAAAFYDRNPHLVEGAGLLAGTLVPGAAGIKALRAAQAAKGSYLGSMLRLPHSTLDVARAEAKKAMLVSDSVYGAINANTMKALTAGAGANILDMAAFEVAATAATFASPVYSDFTAGDYAKSMLTNIAFGAGVGTAFSTAKTFYGTMKAAATTDVTTASLREVKVGAATQTPWINLKGLVEQLDPAEATRQARALGATEETIAALEPARQAAIKDTLTKEVARIAPDAEAAAGFTNLLLSDTVDRAGIVGLAKEVRRGTIDSGHPAARTFDIYTKKAYAAGEAPVKHLGDSISLEQSVVFKSDAVLVLEKGKVINEFKVSKPFSKQSELEAQASWLHAYQPKQSASMEIGADDIPGMEKLLELSDEFLAKYPANIGGKLYRTNKEIEHALFNAKFSAAESLATKLLPEQIEVRLNVKPEFLNNARFENMIARTGDEMVKFIRQPRHISVVYDLPTLTKAVDEFIEFRAGRGETQAAISASSFLQMTGRVAKDRHVASIEKSLKEGKKITPPKIVVKQDGTISFDGNKRATALAKMLQDITHDTDHIPVNVLIEEGAIIPKTLPDGSPFPLVKAASGELMLNPLVNEVPVRLSRAFSEETMRIENLNKIHSAEREQIAASLIPESSVMPSEQVGLELLKVSTRADIGQGFIKNTEGVTGGLGAFTQHVGQLTNKLIQETCAKTETALNAALVKPVADKQFTALSELILVQNHLRGTPANYVLDRTTKSLVREDIAINARKALDKEAAKKEIADILAQRPITREESRALQARITAANKLHPSYGDDVKEFIQLSDDAFEVLSVSTARNSERLATHSQVTASVGHPSLTEAQKYGLERVYMPPVNTKKYPYFVFVRQAETINSTSHTSVLTAASPEDLANKVKILQREYPGMEFVGAPETKYTFHYKKDIESYHKARGDYEYARGMNDNAIDSALRSKKMMYEEAPPIDENHVKEFVSDFMDWHRRMDIKTVRDVVELKYGQLFRELEVMGANYTKTGTSFFGGSTRSIASYAAQTVNNPYGDMIKQALDIGKQLEYQPWTKANEFMNNGWAKASLQVRKLGIAMFSKSTEKELAEEAARLNEISDRLGFGNPYEAAMLKAYKDMLPLNPSLQSNIAKGNAALNFLVLGSDMLQALNTLVGVTVHATEFSSVRSAILRQDALAAGKLTGIAGEQLPSSTAILARSAKEYFTGGKVWNAAKGVWEDKTGKELMDMYIAQGLRVGDAKVLADAVDHFAYNPAYTAKQFGEKVEAGMEKIRKYTGNTPADAISRFMAARSMHILTDIAMSKGVINSVDEAAIYINQHVTRVHGATVASQRPVMFSGPIGQSIGVFMTFYTNFLQRMFQHAGSGDKRALMTMASAQVGLYGLQGLPAFNFVNTHLIGTASGNLQHMDIYQAVGGSEEADWIMYGAGSNLLGLIHPDLKVNLYSRGDLNPRQASIIPVTPQDTALYSAVSKTVSNITNLAQHISGGAGLMPSIAFALEHNGVNRPLSGLGALMSGGQTTTKGSMLNTYANQDLISFASLARLAGGKHLDDATAADALYRMQAYKADRANRVAAVGENMRVAMQRGELPDVRGFMEDYVHAGGDMSNFNKYMKKQFAAANDSQIEKAAYDLALPESEGLARIIGGGFVEE